MEVCCEIPPGVRVVVGAREGEGGWGDEADICRETDKREKTEDGGAEANFSGMQRIDEPGNERRVWSRNKGGDWERAHWVGHTVV